MIYNAVEPLQTAPPTRRSTTPAAPVPRVVPTTPQGFDYRANVQSDVFGALFVYRPGLYSGTSMDSLLHFLDQAGGIDPERGSFLVCRSSAARRCERP